MRFNVILTIMTHFSFRYSDWRFGAAMLSLPTFIYAEPPAQLGPKRVPKTLQSIVVLMVTMNSALNPIIYTLRSNEFNIAFRNVLSRTSRILSRKHHVRPKQIVPSELNEPAHQMNFRLLNSMSHAKHQLKK